MKTKMHYDRSIGKVVVNGKAIERGEQYRYPGSSGVEWRFNNPPRKRTKARWSSVSLLFK